MNQISAFFAQHGMNFQHFLYALIVIVAGSFLLGGVGRFIFGKNSILVGSVSSAIGIIFVYGLNIMLYAAGAQFQKFTTPLPFISIEDQVIHLFHFTGSHYTVISKELVSLVVLAWIMNLIDRIMPKGKNPLLWSFFRILTVVLAQIAHLLVYWIATTYLPDGILYYAPVILLGLLLVFLLTGALKLLVGLFLTTVNPIIAGLYTFFFARVIGKMVTKALLTSAFLALLVYAMERIGITVLSIAIGALYVYIPLLLVLVLLWSIITKLFH